MHVQSIEWLAIPQSPNYEASNTGEIRFNNGSRVHVLKPFMRIRARHPKYLTVKIAIDGKMQRKYVHLLVNSAFNGEKPFPKAVTRHLNGHSLDNGSVNLRWGTQAENNEDKYWHGTAARVLNLSQARYIRALKAAGYSYSQCAAWYCVSEGTIWKILTNRIFKEVY